MTSSAHSNAPHSENSVPRRAPADTPDDPPREADVTAAFRRPPHDWIDVGHSRLAYWRFGRGPDVVFVHGWPLHAATFRRVVPLLADAFTCHLIDLPGAGQTEWTRASPLDFATHPVTVRRAIDALGLGRYALLAHDSGGFIARHVAADDAARVAALVLGNTEIPGHRSGILWVLQHVMRPLGERGALGPILRQRFVRRSVLGFGGCFDDAAYTDGEFAEFFVDTLLGDRRTAYGQLRVLSSMNQGLIDALATVHPRIRAPARLVWGARDPFFPLATARRRLLPQFAAGTELREIPRGKLFAHEDFPHEFVAHARAFLLEHAG
jgi:haloalkane dehalogenase